MMNDRQAGFWSLSSGGGHGSAVHLHDTDGRGGREGHGKRTRPALNSLLAASGGGSGGTGAGPGGGRRPPGAPVRPRRPLEVGLHAGCDRGLGGGAPARGGGEARSGPARPHAAGDRRHRADEGHPRGGRRAGHLRVRLRPGRAHRQGRRHGAVDYVVKPFSPRS